MVVPTSREVVGSLSINAFTAAHTATTIAITPVVVVFQLVFIVFP
jgi:hypothetical protein